KGLESQDILSAAPLGFSSAEVNFKIVDPTALTGDTYQVDFDIDESDQVSYTVINTSRNETMLENLTDIIFEDTDPETGETFLANAGEKFVVDGFTVNIRDLGKETLLDLGTQFAVLDVLEIQAGSTVLEEPVSLNDRTLNSTGAYTVFPQGANNRYNWQGRRNQEGLGTDFYEIRFTSSGSDFFATGYATGTLQTVPTRDDQKGEGKVPFEVWNIGQTPDDPSDDVRLIVKIMDNNNAQPDSAINDLKWTRLPSGNWEEIYAYEADLDPDNLPAQSDRSDFTDHKFGAFVISGARPSEGTVLRLSPAIPITGETVYEITMPEPNLNSTEVAKNSIDKIGVFPNPYFGTHGLEVSKYDRYMRFINLPKQATIRIFNLGGAFITKLDKDDNSDYIDWDIRNKDGLPVASGMYIAYVDLPNIGSKVLKLAVIIEAQYIDRI
ncbi:MAG: hypothetical protein R3250_03455, partial [Melioribacteraceae bacterium]|nr:hypothetical protein [Melioribacteraceae bacterium]